MLHQDFIERFAFNIFHHENRRISEHDAIVARGDAIITERRQCFGLFYKLIERMRIIDRFNMHDLQDHTLTHLIRSFPVESKKHLPHAAFAKLTFNQIAIKNDRPPSKRIDG